MIRYILISLEIWGIVLCIIAGICVYLTREHDIKGAKLIRRLLTVEILLCIDQITLLVLSGHIAGWSVVLCKSMTLLVFLLNNVLLALNAVFVAYSIKKRGGEGAKGRKHADLLNVCDQYSIFRGFDVYGILFYTE